jgi:ABC-type sugar transport system ATPase subunit
MVDHDPAHVPEVCDRANVPQHGESRFDRAVNDTAVEELTELMVDEHPRHLTGG